MKVLQVFATGLRGNRTALMTSQTYTPYAIVTDYDPSAKEDEQWASAYGYYTSFQAMCAAVTELEYPKEDVDIEELLEDYGYAFMEYHELLDRPDWWTPEKEDKALDEFLNLKNKITELIGS